MACTRGRDVLPRQGRMHTRKTSSARHSIQWNYIACSPDSATPTALKGPHAFFPFNEKNLQTRLRVSSACCTHWHLFWFGGAAHCTLPHVTHHGLRHTLTRVCHRTASRTRNHAHAKAPPGAGREEVQSHFRDAFILPAALTPGLHGWAGTAG